MKYGTGITAQEKAVRDVSRGGNRSFYNVHCIIPEIIFAPNITLISQSNKTRQSTKQKSINQTLKMSIMTA